MAQWRENDAQWYEEKMLFCTTSGRMIARLFLAEEIDGRTRIFATPEDLELYKDYVLVERGEDYRPPENIGDTYADLMVK
ncbi:MAG: hypothetical protein IT338_01430 [Thermomicrobiales bacterium]|nr:hypothetical protein [Thermomicrobiales bacterium]